MAKVDVYNLAKEKVGSTELVDAVFNVEVKEHLFHLVVRAQLAVRRQGTHSTKQRAMVAGGGRKPWKQKGTGRARQGSTRSPQWRGGGTVFGPQPRSHAFQTNKKVRRAALRSALSRRAGESALVVLDKFSLAEAKTRHFRTFMKAFGFESLLVHGPFSIQSESTLAAVNQMLGPQLHYWGAYSQASYFLTGESRPYDKKTGALDRLVPLRPFIHEHGCLQGPGAWELAARWSTIDLNNANRNGGQLTDLTAGLNWYLNGYTKLQFNYIHAMLDHPTLGNSQANIAGLRCQVDF